MGNIVKNLTIEETVDRVFTRIEKADPNSPETLRDHVTAVGQFDPYKASVALRIVRGRLRPGGTHDHLTDSKKWAYEREQWAKEAGLQKGRAEREFEPETETTQALTLAMEANVYLPENARDAVTSISKALAQRANRKLDEHSAAMVGESVEELMHEMEVQARLMDEKDVRIQQAERHAEDLRRTNDRLLAIMEQVIGKSVTDNALVSRRSEDEKEEGGARQRSN